MSGEIASVFAEAQTLFMYMAGFAVMMIGAHALSGKMNWGWLWNIGVAIFIIATAGFIIGEFSSTGEYGSGQDVIAEALAKEHEGQVAKLVRIK